MVRGDAVMPGYWENPEATEKTLVNGWLMTGDMGVLDEDGYLTLQDRSKDMIITGGSNVYPREVEEVLLMHPQVREVSVVGRPMRIGARKWWPLSWAMRRMRNWMSCATARLRGSNAPRPISASKRCPRTTMARC